MSISKRPPLRPQAPLSLIECRRRRRRWAWLLRSLILANAAAWAVLALAVIWP